MTSKIVVNNIEADAGVSTVTFGSDIQGNLIGNVTSSSTSTFSNGLNVTGGSVGIGTDNPSKPLQVHSDSSSAVLVTGSTPQIRFNSNVGDGSDGDRVILGRATGNDQFIGGSVDGDAILRSATSKKVIIGYGTTEIAQFNSSGLKFKTSGMGIDFSAASGSAAGSTSALLDDYEEGTFTPTLTFGGGSTGITYASRNGSYTKIGKVVVVRVGVLLSNKGSSTGTAAITGLPFTVESISYADGTGCFGFTNMTGLGGGPLVGVCGNGSTQFQLWSGNSTSRIITSDTNYANNTEFYGTITYTTT